MSQRAQRLIEAARKLPVPEGTYAVGLGLIISGHHRLRLPDPGVQGPHARRSTPRSTASGSSCSSSRPGFFLPLEQEVGRAVADRRSRRHRRRAGRPQGRAGGRRPHRLADRPVDRRLRGVPAHRSAVPRPGACCSLCFVIALATYAVQHLTRGTLSGNGRFGPYGMILGGGGRRPHPAADRRLVASAIDRPRLVRPRARDPAGARQRRVAARPARSDGTRARRRVVGALHQPHAALPRVAHRAGAQLLRRPRRLVLAQGPKERARRRRLHRRVLHRPHPDPALPGVQAALLPKLAAPRRRRPARRLPHRAQEAGDDRHRGRRPRRRRRRHDRPDGRQDPLRRQVQPRQRRPRRCCSPAAPRSSSPSRSRRR